MEHLKNKTRIQKFKETGDSRYFYRKGVDKACFQHDMAYGDFKCIPRKTASDKVLLDKVFKTAGDSKDDGYQRELAPMVYKFFDKKSRDTTNHVGAGIIFENWPMSYTIPSLENFRGAKYTHLIKVTVGILILQTCNKYNKRVHFLLCGIDIYSRYV